MLLRRRKEYREGRIVADKRKKVVSARVEMSEHDRIRQLEKENTRLRQENDLLKKGQRLLAEEHQSGIDSSRETEK